jgi:hypothetical protein
MYRCLSDVFLKTSIILLLISYQNDENEILILLQLLRCPVKLFLRVYLTQSGHSVKQYDTGALQNNSLESLNCGDRQHSGRPTD